MEAVELDHIAFAVPRLADVTPFLVGELGGRAHIGGPGKGFVGAQWVYDGGGRLEVIEPDGPEGGFMHRFLERRGPGLHHVTFKVPDLSATCDRAGELGYDVVGFDESREGWKEAFLHPKQALGIVVQIVETGPRQGGSWESGFRFPPSPPPGEPPVRIVGLRMRGPEAEPVRRQWEELLSGECSEDASDLVFRWPASPMRISVTIRPGMAAEPLWVEVGCPRPVALPEHPHPVLGSRFVSVQME